MIVEIRQLVGSRTVVFEAEGRDGRWNVYCRSLPAAAQNRGAVGRHMGIVERKTPARWVATTAAGEPVVHPLSPGRPGSWPTRSAALAALYLVLTTRRRG